MSDLKFLTVQEIAAALRVSVMTIYRLGRSGDLETVRVGRNLRVPEAALTAYLRGTAGHGHQPAPPGPPPEEPPAWPGDHPAHPAPVRPACPLRCLRPLLSAHAYHPLLYHLRSAGREVPAVADAVRLHHGDGLTTVRGLGDCRAREVQDCLTAAGLLPTAPGTAPRAQGRTGAS